MRDLQVIYCPDNQVFMHVDNLGKSSGVSWDEEFLTCKLTIHEDATYGELRDALKDMEAHFSSRVIQDAEYIIITGEEVSQGFSDFEGDLHMDIDQLPITTSIMLAEVSELRTITIREIWEEMSSDKDEWESW